jgi:hypothetical protein
MKFRVSAPWGGEKDEKSAEVAQGILNDFSHQITSAIRLELDKIGCPHLCLPPCPYTRMLDKLFSETTVQALQPIEKGDK